MRQSPKLRPTIWDGLVILTVVLLAVVCALAVWRSGGDGQALTAVISVDGSEVDRLSLKGLVETERTIQGSGYTLRVVLSSEGVRVAEANCPTQDCVHTGTITRSGQSIVCLPGRVIITLEGGGETDNGVDAVVG
jgi:hypothetical protein